MSLPEPRRQKGLAGLAFAFTSALAATALASPPRTSSLSWVRLPGADSCVATQDLAKDVEGLLGRSVFVSASHADVSVEGRIEPKPRGGFRAAIVIRDDQGALLGTREIEGEGACGPMREQLALVIAVMIDPDAIGRPSPPPSPVPPPTPTPTPTPPLAPPVPAREPPTRPKPRWHLDAGASLAGEAGLLPHATLGARADALLTPPRWIPLEGYGVLWPYDDASKGAANGSFTLALVGGGLCPLHFLSERVLLYGCASGILGLVWSSGNGSPNGASPVLAAEVEGRLGFHVGGPFVARVGIAAVIPILRDSYVGPPTASNPPLYRMSVVAGTADLGMGFAF